MATKEQLMSAMRKAHEAGDSSAASRFAGMIKSQSEPKPTEFESSLGLKPQKEKDIFSGLPPEVAESIKQQTSELVKMGLPFDGNFNIKQAESLAEFERLKISKPELAQVIEETGNLQALGVGYISGLKTIGRGISRPFVDVSEEEKAEREKERATLEALKSKRGAATVGEIAGEAAPFLPAGLASSGIKSLAGRVATSGLVGGVEGATIEAGKGGDAEKIATGAAIGTLLLGSSEAMLPLLNKSIKRTLGGGQAMPETLITKDGPTPKLQKILSEKNVDIKDLFADIAQDTSLPSKVREEIFEKLGTTATRAQSTRDPTLFGKQLEASADTGPVRDALTKQDRILTEVATGELNKIGGTPLNAPSSPIEAITDKSLQLDKKIGDLYARAREAAPGEKNVRFSKSSQMLRQNLPINARTDGTVKAIRDQMKQLGFLDPAGKPTRLVSVEASENLRQFANTLFDGANPLAKSFIREFKDALDDDVFSVAGTDVFKEARAAKTGFMQGISAKKGHKFDQRTKSLVKDLLEGTVQEDDLVKKVISRGSQYKAKEIKELKEYLLTGTEGQTAQGMQAWNDIRSAAMDDVISKAFVGPMNELGSQTLTRAGLKRALESIGPAKMNVIFSKPEIGFLRDLARISTLKEAPAGVTKSPSGAAIRQLESTLSAVPIVGRFALSALESVQSRASNDAILKLVDDAKVIQRMNEDNSMRAFRQSGAGQAAMLAPAAAIPLISSE